MLRIRHTGYMDPHPYLASRKPRAFAHRGWHMGEFTGLENTLAALREAVRQGYEYLEIDVQVTADGVVVVHHDPTLDRVTNLKGHIGEVPWSELKEARVNGSEPISALSEVFEELPNAKFNIDVKCDAAVEPFVDLIQRMRTYDRIAMASFSTRRLHLMRKMFGADGGEVPIASMTPVAVFALWAAARLRAPAAAVLRHVAWGGMAQVPATYRGLRVVDEKFIRTAHALGAEVHVWVIDTEEEMHEFLDMGADGIVTDRPDLLLRVLKDRG